MKNKVSKRCGKGSCKHYNQHDSVSGCYIYNDRRLCVMSIAHRNKVAKHSRKKRCTDNYFNY